MITSFDSCTEKISCWEWKEAQRAGRSMGRLLAFIEEGKGAGAESRLKEQQRKNGNKQ